MILHAAAKATALPVIVAVKLLLEKKMPRDIVGVHHPLLPDLYNTILWKNLECSVPR